MTENDSSDPKIHVDNDWKSQVEAEKEQIKKEMESAQVDAEMPPASLPILVSTLATQAMLAMGLVPDPTGNVKPDRAVAKHMIDLLGMLEEKTKGNATKEEESMLTETLHQLRMAFVSIPETPESGQTEAESKPTIELP